MVFHRGHFFFISRPYFSNFRYFFPVFLKLLLTFNNFFVEICSNDRVILHNLLLLSCFFGNNQAFFMNFGKKCGFSLIYFWFLSRFYHFFHVLAILQCFCLSNIVADRVIRRNFDISGFAKKKCNFCTFFLILLTFFMFSCIYFIFVTFIF